MFRFQGIQRLFGKQDFQKIQSAHVSIIGLGGVGSWSAEALARSGVQQLTLVDLDDICESNINRQIHSLSSSIGKMKVQEMRSRILEIQPDCKVNCIEDFYTPESSDRILSLPYDCVIDAIDSLKPKAHLIMSCRERSRKIVSVGAAGGRQDPTKVKTCDLSDAYNDALLAKLRRKLRQDYSFSREGKFNVACVFSTELAKYPMADGCVSEDKSQLKGHSLDCEGSLGSASFVTGSFGFYAAYLAIKEITANPEK